MSLPESGALPSATRQSLKNTRQSLYRVSHLAKRARRTVHRQRLLCRVLFLWHSAKTLSSARRYSAKKSGCHGAGVTETASLPSVYRPTLDKESASGVPLSGSLSSALCGTRHSMPLCRVPGPPHSAKKLYWCPGIGAECNTRQSDQYTSFKFVFSIPSKQTKDTSHISHIYITNIIIDINIQHKH
jgi:hypothetical protein